MASSMTLRAAAQGARYGSADDYTLRDLVYRYGKDCAGPWLVVRTAYHGGGIVSHHRQIMRAIAAMRRLSNPECYCDCVGIVLAADYESLRDANTASPYELAR